MSTSGVCKGLAVLAVAVVVGFGSLSWKKYLKSRPQDFADPRTTTLRHVSEWDRKQGVVGNTTVGGKR